MYREREKGRPGLEPLTIKRMWRADKSMRASFAQLKLSSVAFGKRLQMWHYAARRALQWLVCGWKRGRGEGGRYRVGSPRLSLVRSRLRLEKTTTPKMTFFFSLLLKQTPHWTDLRASAKPLFPPAVSQTLHRVGLNYRNIMQRDVVLIWALTSVRRKAQESDYVQHVFKRFLRLYMRNRGATKRGGQGGNCCLLWSPIYLTC